jgi:hypothetical protein
MTNEIFYLGGFFLVLEGGLSIAANPNDPILWQIGRLTRILFGFGIMARGAK